MTADVRAAFTRSNRYTRILRIVEEAMRLNGWHLAFGSDDPGAPEAFAAWEAVDNLLNDPPRGQKFFLTPKVRADIEKAVANGGGFAAVAKKYGVAPSTVQHHASRAGIKGCSRPMKQKRVSDEKIKAALPLGLTKGAQSVGLSKVQFALRRRRILEGLAAPSDTRLPETDTHPA